MSNEKQIEILRLGADAWNKWRIDNPGARVNLRGAFLTGYCCREANLRRADLGEAHLDGIDLGGADLSEADLKRTVFSNAQLYKTNFSNTRIGETVFANTDLSNAMALDESQHITLSYVDVHTIRRSKGQIPLRFLRGCGLSDWEIESAKLFNPDLDNNEINSILYKIYDLRAERPIQISPLFISYSHIDSLFVDKMERYLDDRGIRFWRDVHHATAGRLEKQIDHAIRHNPTMLLVLSQNSTKSDWVEHEVRTARRLEKETKRDVLCPIGLDDSWKTSSWPERIREQIMEYNILDFSDWEDDTNFSRLFKKLIDGLNMFYQ